MTFENSPIVNVAFAITLFPRFVEAGIAGAEVIAGWTNAACLYAALARRRLFTLDARVRRNAPRLLFCAMLMGGLLVLGKIAISPFLQPESGLAAQAAAVLLLVAAGAAVYFGSVHLTGAVDLRGAARMIRRRPAGTDASRNR